VLHLSINDINWQEEFPMSNRNEVSEIIKELESDELSEMKLSDADIVKKYDERQARIIIQRNNFLIPNLLQMVKESDILNLSLPYQRRKQWNGKQRSLLIESLLINIPIPPISLYEHNLAKYEVMDGRQRLDAIRAFFDNEFRLRDLKKLPELNGRFFSDLPYHIQAGLRRRGLAAVIILTESGQTDEEALEIRQCVFERLNTGGENLNSQEVRNYIYASPFNEMLVKVARSELFTSAWGIPPKEPDEPEKAIPKLAQNRLYATMADCEIVLRYFALADLSYFKGGIKRTLDECMRRMKNAPPRRCKGLQIEYLVNLNIATQIYGDSLFRLPSRKGELVGRRSIPLSDAVLLSIRNLGQVAKKLPDCADYLQDQTKLLLNNEDKYEILVGRRNTKDAVEARIQLTTEMFRQALEG
jgi:hypothetical protein